MRAKFYQYLKTTNTWFLVGIAIVLAVFLTTLMNLIFAQAGWDDQITPAIMGLAMIDAFVAAALVSPLLIIMLKRAAQLEDINRQLEQEVTDQRQTEQAVVQRAANLTLINEMALACAAIDADTDLPRLIADKLHTLTRAIAVSIASYNPETQTLTVQHVSASGQIFSTFKKVWEHNIIGVSRPLDPALKQRMLSEVVFVTSDVTKNILDLIPQPIAVALQKTLGIGGFNGLALIYDGELWGTAAIILHADQAPLEREVAVALSHIIAITMHRQAAERALRCAEEKFRSIVENAMEGIFQSTPDGRFLSVNSAMARMYGYASPQEMIQKVTDISQQLYADSTKRTEVKHRLETEGYVQDFESQDRRKDGSVFWTSMNVRTVRDEQGQTLYYEGTTEDVSARKQAEEALRQSQERYANFVEQSLEGIWMLAFDEPIPLSLPEAEQARRLQALGYVAECNDAMARMYGYTSSRELIGKRVEELYGGLTKEANFASSLQLVQSSYRAGNRETHEVTKTGDSVYFLNNAVGVIENESLVALWGTQRDITALKQAEQALRESEERYRTIVDGINDAIFIHNVDSGAIVDVNNKMCEMYGYTREEARQLEIEVISSGEPPYTQQEAMAWMQKARQGEPQIFEWRAKDKNGRLFWVEVNARHAVIAGQDRLLVVIRDITERMQAAERLQQYKRAVDGSVEVMAAVDKNYMYLFANKAYLEYHQLNEEQITGHHYSEVVGKENFEKNLKPLMDKCLAGEILHFETTYTYREMGKRYMDAWYYPLLDQDQQVQGVVGIARDITERKQAEEAKAQLEEQLRQAQKMETVGRLAGGVAHDFNNMLTAILGFAELLLSRFDVDEGASRYVGQIKNAAERAASLTQQLLAFSRKQMLQPKIFNLNTLVANIENMLHRLIGEDIELVTLLDPDLGQVEADPVQIDQVLMNLAVNARDAMPNGGKLTIETKNVYLDETYTRQYVEVKPGPYVMLTVTDTGIGMDRETQARLFEPFFTTKEMGKGTGLGLATIYGIVKQSDGHIYVYSEVAQGTTFKIYLPRLKETIETELHPALATELQEGDETILLVEDAEMVRNLARSILDEGGYTVLEAADGYEALQLCQKHRGPIHLLLTDVIMPGMSGRELGEQIMLLRPEIKILYMSGYTDDAIVHHGMLEPGIAFLQKPFSPTILTHKLRQVLDTTG